MRIGFTDHAVDRYIQFHTDPEADPKPTRPEIRALLDLEASNAVRLKEKSVRGDTQWRIEALGIVCITKPDNGEHVCVTILPPHRDLNGMTAYEMEIVKEKLDELHAKEEAAKKQRVDVVQEAARIEKMPKEMFEHTPMDKGDTLALIRARQGELTKLIEKLTHERALFSDYFKTIRHAVTHDTERQRAKDALRVAMRFLSARGADDAIKEIARIDPSFARFDFYKESA